MGSEKLKIGIDLDDTVWKFHEKFIDYYNTKFGTDYNVSDYSKYSIAKFFGISYEEEKRLLKEFMECDFSQEVVLVEGFLETFSKLKDTFEIYFITARPTNLKEMIQKKLKAFGASEFPVYHISNGDFESEKTKFEVCKEIGVDVMIDVFWWRD